MTENEKLIYYVNGDTSLRQKTKHVVNFFGILGCIKVNALGETTSRKKEDKFNIVKYYFDYPYFSKIVNPECFQGESENGEKKLARVLLSLWLFSIMLSTTSIVLSYLAYGNQKSKKVIAGLIAASAVFAIVASVFFVAGLVWMFFDFVKEKLIVHRMKAFLKEECSPGWIKLFKDKLIKEKSKIEETHDQELETDKNIEEILQFFLKKKNILALYHFLTNGEELVQAGMVMVNMLLLDGVHPNDIVLDTNSLGGGIATEVLRRFEEKKIFLTLINSNSFSSLSNVANTFKRPFHVKCLNILEKLFGLELNSEKVIKNTKCPVLIASRKGDKTIEESAQLAGKLDNIIVSEETFRLSIVLEHDPTIQNCSIKNIHTDHADHLVYKDGEDYESYIKVKSDFIDIAPDYLEKFNEGFNLGEYTKSDFSGKLTKVTLELIGNTPLLPLV
jgi:hypothetical protein